MFLFLQSIMICSLLA